MNDEQLLREADLCVKCGLCLPHCPTYRLSLDECESPRGRIALIQGMVSAGLPVDGPMRRHLENCLHCLNCSNACPSGVKYSIIIDAAICRLPRHSAPVADALSHLATSAFGRETVRKFRKSPLYPVTLKLAPRKQQDLLRLLPPLSEELSLETVSPANASTSLFLGCLSQLADQPVFAAFSSIAQRLGVLVSVPRSQGCCGAIHGHTGYQAKADKCRQRNIQAFDGANRVISFASGCGAYLQTYLGGRVMDATAFLEQTAWPQDIRLKAFDGLIAIHTPCSLRNTMKSESPVFRLLGKIPGAACVPLSVGYGCCGGAGMHLMDPDGASQQLLEPILDQIAQLRPKIVLTSNTGCHLHMRRGLEKRGIDIPIRHPVELIADLLPLP